MKNYVIIRCRKCNVVKAFDWSFEKMMEPGFQDTPEFKEMMEFTLAHIMHDSYQVTIKTDKANYKLVADAADKLINDNLR